MVESMDAHLNAMKLTSPVVYNRLIPSGNDYVGFLMSPETLSTLGPSEQIVFSAELEKYSSDHDYLK